MPLRECNPPVKDVTLDVDGMNVAKANTKVDDTNRLAAGHEKSADH